MGIEEYVPFQVSVNPVTYCFHSYVFYKYRVAGSISLIDFTHLSKWVKCCSSRHLILIFFFRLL